MPESEMTGNIFHFVAAAAEESREAKSSESLPVPETVAAAARLVGRICDERDGEAFNEFYKMFAPMVHGIVLARVPRDEADDIVQNVFLAAHKNLPAVRDRERVGAWLAMIARNFANEFYRRAKTTEKLTENYSRGNGGDGGSQPETEAREILAAIRALPDAYRETLILRLVEGMTGAEIAAQTGLKPESVRVNLHRGMKMLRRRLGVEE